jgi:ATP phosphoribosyltransferase
LEIRLQNNEKLVLALPKGRILDEVMPVVGRAGIFVEPEFANENSRQLRFSTNHPGLDVIRVRNFDVATFVAFGAAHLGVAGNDVLMEFDYPEIYAPLDLDIGHCRLAVATPVDGAAKEDPSRWSHVRVATKYPEITRRHFAARGVQAECIKLNGAMELAPNIGLCRYIVDLVQTGSSSIPPACASPPRRSPRRRDPAISRRWAPCASPPTASKPTTDGRCRRTWTTSTSRASGWARAGRRSRRSGSMSPAAPLHTRPRC